jgi:hypothetical protein
MHAITELPVYADEDLERLDSTALIALMVRDEDRVPRNVIAACTRLGEPMVEALGEAIDRGRAPEEEHPGEWWLRLHAAMILGLMPCESAGLVLGRLLRRIEREADDNMQDWLAGRWPALFANKPPASIEAACALAEDRDLDWYARCQAVEVALDAALREGPQALEQTLDRIAARAADDSEDWDMRCADAAALLDFPRERHRALVKEIAAREATRPGFGVRFDAGDVEESFAMQADEPGWKRLGDPWAFYSPEAIAARQARWAEEDVGLEDEELLEDEDLFDDENLHLPEPYVREAPKIGRNDPCPCGSGRKYKRCCLGREEA